MSATVFETRTTHFKKEPQLLKDQPKTCRYFMGQIENSETSEISKKNFGDFQIQVFDFGSRAKSKIRKYTVFFFFLKNHQAQNCQNIKDILRIMARLESV